MKPDASSIDQPNTDSVRAAEPSSPDQSVSLTDLLAQARADQLPALERLFGECRNYLVIAARAQLGTGVQSKLDASDIVQQTLLEAYRDFPKFRGETEAEWVGWLRQILRRNLLNAVRTFRDTEKRAVNKEIRFDPGGDADRSNAVGQLAANDDSPSGAVIRKENEMLIADALTQLSPDHQQVIVLRNLQKLPFDEIATQMNRSRPATQMLWMRAMEKLTQVMTTLRTQFGE